MIQQMKQCGEFSSCTSQLKSIREFVEQQCDALPFDDDKKAMVILAIDEACANVIRHGYKMSSAGCLSVEYKAEASHAVFTIKDNCQPICEQVLAPKPENLQQPGGLGMQLIHMVADSVRLVPHEGGGNWLELKIPLEKSSA